MNAKTFLLVLGGAVCLCACADVPQRTVSPPQPEVSAALSHRITIGATQNLPHSGKFPANRVWQYMGSLPEGAVYKPVNAVFTVEAKHVHEAYLVLRDTQLVGYYLPVEGTISVLEAPAQLNVTPLMGEK